MTEPTQAELREIAEKNMAWLERIGLSDDVQAVLADYLRLTDPEPLTAEHCREAELDGGEPGEWHSHARPHLTTFTEETYERFSELSVMRPTLGILRLALLQENSDGE